MAYISKYSVDYKYGVKHPTQTFKMSINRDEVTVIEYVTENAKFHD